METATSTTDSSRKRAHSSPSSFERETQRGRLTSTPHESFDHTVDLNFDSSQNYSNVLNAIQNAHATLHGGEDLKAVADEIANNNGYENENMQTTTTPTSHSE